MFFSAPKLMVVLAVTFFVFAVPLMTAATILIRRYRESKKDG